MAIPICRQGKTGRKLKGTSQNFATNLDNGQWHSVESVTVQYQYQVSSLHYFFPDLLYMCVGAWSVKLDI